jgi:hypothetical protein
MAKQKPKQTVKPIDEVRIGNIKAAILEPRPGICLSKTIVRKIATVPVAATLTGSRLNGRH